jgi:hypothetical protein
MTARDLNSGPSSFRFPDRGITLFLSEPLSRVAEGGVEEVFVVAFHAADG